MARQPGGVVRVVVSAIVALLLALSGLLTLAVPEAHSASFLIRLEAGPQPALAFSSSWAVTGRRSVTLKSPSTVYSSARTTVPGRGVYLRVASGSLAGWWVAEGRTAYRPGIVTTAVYTPARTVRLAAARYELYRFDSTGALTAAKRLVTTTSTSLHADRAAVVNGLRHVRITGGAWAGWWLPGTLAAPERITCTAGSPPRATTGRIVRSVPAATREIALTFDMGGRLTPAMSILRYLELERVCATVFPTGAAATTTIGRQVMAEIRGHPELFELGNHTQHHCNLRDGGAEQPARRCGHPPPSRRRSCGSPTARSPP
ncbi:MAG: polysaccharide deacetylase family protein [Candidatus Limnocylindrales bacterium]